MKPALPVPGVPPPSTTGCSKRWAPSTRPSARLAASTNEVLEAERTDLDRSGRRGARASESWPAGEGLLAMAAVWTGAAGRSALEGLAAVVDPAAAEVIWIPAATLASPDVSAALAGRGGRWPPVGGARRQGADAQPPRPRRRRAVVGPRHHDRRLPPRSGRGALRPARAARPLRRRSAPRRRPPRPTASSTSTTTPWTPGRVGPVRPWPCTAWPLRSPTPSTPEACGP